VKHYPIKVVRATIEEGKKKEAKTVTVYNDDNYAIINKISH